MSANAFLKAGVEVEIRRLDERGDSLYAIAAAGKGDTVALKWKGTPPTRAPAGGSMVRVIRTNPDGRQSAIKALIHRVDASALSVIPRSRPSPYDKRTFLRVEGDLMVSFEIVPPEDVEQMQLDIENKKVASTTRRPQLSPVPGRRSSRPTASAGVAPELSRRLDRLEQKLDDIMELLQKGQPTELGAREACRTDISGSGIRFLASNGVPGGAAIDMAIELPLSPTVTIRVLVEVLRSDPDGKGKFWIAGRYLAIHEAHRGEIVRYSFERQREQRKREERAEGS